MTSQCLATLHGKENLIRNCGEIFQSSKKKKKFEKHLVENANWLKKSRLNVYSVQVSQPPNTC